jgi:hypothetical protein
MIKFIATAFIFVYIFLLNVVLLLLILVFQVKEGTWAEGGLEQGAEGVIVT